MECLKQFLANPTKHLNDLNVIIPVIIQQNDIDSATLLLNSIIEANLVSKDDFKYLISKE